MNLQVNMDRNFKKIDDKKAEKTSRDRGDLRKNMLGKVIEDLTIKDFIPTCDRGDSKPCPIRTQRTESSQTQSNSKLTKTYVEKNTANENEPKSLFLAKKEVKRVTVDSEYHGEARKKEQNAKVSKKEVEKTKTEEAKAKHLPHGKDAKKTSDKIEENGADQLNISFPDLDKKLGAVVSPLKDVKTAAVVSLIKHVKTAAVVSPIKDVKTAAMVSPIKDVKIAAVVSAIKDVKIAAVVSPIKEVKTAAVVSLIKNVKTPAVVFPIKDVKIAAVVFPIKEVKTAAVVSPIIEVKTAAVVSPIKDVKTAAVVSPIKYVKIAAMVSPIKDVKTSDKLDSQNRTYLDLEGRKILREKYTIKLKRNQHANKNSDVIVDDYTTKNYYRDTKKQTDVETSEKVKTNEPKDATQKETTISVNKLKELKEPLVQRKPVIKTIRLNHEHRVYKAVTFTDQKESTALKIKIPNNFKKDKRNESKLFIHKIKAPESKVSVQKKAKKKDESLYRAKSPLIVRNNPSPPTEVAKWAPSCVSHQTKPYYEAWVNTTLAAISKCSEQEKQNVIKTFKRVLDERPQTPDFAYDQLNDERYTGKITVRR